MKISILLPYKENYSPDYPGAVSLFISSTIKLSKFKKNITVYGSTNYSEKLTSNYKNIVLKKSIFSSQTKEYLDNFLKLEKKNNSDLIEVHNRPNYVHHLKVLNKKIILYFHNDPNTMLGSRNPKERIGLINSCSKIIFNSHWSKSQFLKDLTPFYHKSGNLLVIHQSINRKKVNLNIKEKLITFVGKLNSSKGYDLFGSAIIKILNKYPSWRAVAIGDEFREKYNFKHKNLNILGFLKHQEVLKIFEKTSISIACSRWEEPFGRTSLEASSRGCAVIISDRGGLPETITNAIILRKLEVNHLYDEIEKLITNKKKLLYYQSESLKNFYLTDTYISKKIDDYRKTFSIKYTPTKKMQQLKILHVTNFNERHNGRLFYNTGRRINNGLIRLNHSVLELSDRDIVSYARNISDLKGAKKLNSKFIEIISNYLPDMIIFGHADLVNNETISFIKKSYPNIKMSQWFLDRMDGEWAVNKNRFFEKIELMDANFCTTDPKSFKLNKNLNVMFMPNPVDPSLEKLENYNNNFFKSDVFFAMSHGVHRGVLKKGKIDDREKFINKLIDKTPNIRFGCFGMNGVQPIWSDDYLRELSQSKIGLNLSQGNPTNFYSSDRFSQIIGNGLLVMVDRKTNLGKFFDKDEIVLYNDVSDLSEKIIKYSYDNKLRKKIAHKGKNKYFKYFNSNIVAEFIINRTLGNNNKKYYWETFL